MHLFLCQYHTVLIMVALKDSLKSGDVILPALFFIPQDCFGISGSFVGPNSFRISSGSVRNVLGILIGIVLNL